MRFLKALLNTNFDAKINVEYQRELALYRKAIKVIRSCTAKEQLPSMDKYINLVIPKLVVGIFCDSIEGEADIKRLELTKNIKNVIAK